MNWVLLLLIGGSVACTSQRPIDGAGDEAHQTLGTLPPTGQDQADAGADAVVDAAMAQASDAGPGTGILLSRDLEPATLPRLLPASMLGTLAGQGAPQAPAGLRLYGTDLGLSYTHAGKHFMLFGDTWSHPAAICDAPEPDGDDTVATLPLQYSGQVPVASFATVPGSPQEARTIRVDRDGQLLPMGFGQVPMGPFSDGERAYSFFAQLRGVRCGEQARPGEPPCPSEEGFSCSTRLGECDPPLAPLPVLCDLGTQLGCVPGQECQARSICLDTTSSQYEDTLLGNSSAIAQDTVLAVQDEDDPTDFRVVASLATNKFANIATATVRSFSSRFDGNDYVTGHGSLLVWGRPGFVAEHSRQAHLYLMQQPLPLQLDDAGQAQLRPQYYAGLDPRSGEPLWSDQQTEAVPLPLDGRAQGDPTEALPVVNQMSIRWLGSPIKRWIMLYAGDAPDYLMLNGEASRQALAPGSVMARFAEHPWGPWSVPVPHHAPGVPEGGDDPYGPGGYLYHPACASQGPAMCALTDPHRPPDSALPGCVVSLHPFDPGRMYGVNIIEDYTQQNDSGGLDLFWNVSTWNPYRVMLMRSSVQPPDALPDPGAELADVEALRRLTDWRSLPVFGGANRYRQQSSADRGMTDNSFPLSGNGNRDFNNFICASEDAELAPDQFAPFLFDHPSCEEDYVQGVVLGRFEGSGRMVRTWIGMASLMFAPADQEVFRIYVDDDPTPRVEVLLRDALDGEAGEMFAPPFGTGSARRMAWYYPVSFRRKLIVTLDRLGAFDEYFYQHDVVFDEEPSDAPLPNSRLVERDRAALALSAVHHPAGDLAPLVPVRSVTLGAGERETIELAGPATIYELRVRIPLGQTQALADVHARAYWDDAREPAISVSLLELFGGGNVPPALSSPALASVVEGDERVLSLQLPMPYQSDARWEFEQHGDSEVTFQVGLFGDAQVPTAEFGRLHVQKSATLGPTTASHHEGIVARGRGRLVGACQLVEGYPDANGGIQYDSLNLLEGDVQITVDGELALDGTGTEEYADDVFYFADAPYATAFAQTWGKASDATTLLGQASLCRWHVRGTELDFNEELRLTIELGGAGNPETVSRQRTIAYLYY